MNDVVLKALNKQINAELYSSYLYLSMEAYFRSIKLPGFAHWMKVQVREENEHAMKLYDYVFDRNARVTLESIDAPKTEWGSPLEVFQDTYKHECKVTGMIDSLVKLCRSENDSEAAAFLKWYVNEQVEEEANSKKVVESLKAVGASRGALDIVDKELAKRR